MQNRSPISGSPLLASVLLAACLVNQNFSQTEAGSKAGYGKVYEAAGKSAAARNVQTNMNLTLQRAVARSKKKAPAESAGRTRGALHSRPSLAGASSTFGVRSTFFKPDPNFNTATVLADSLGTNAEERVMLRQLFSATKTAFESEVASKGRQNNLAAAFTFFIATTATVYHDDPEPSDKAIDDLWDALNATLEETPDVAKLSDREKQELYDTVISFSGLLLAGYLEGKNTNNQETLRSSKMLAGALIQIVLKTDPARLRFIKEGLMLG